jgi:hypothetical protein
MKFRVIMIDLSKVLNLHHLAIGNHKKIDFYYSENRASLEIHKEGDGSMRTTITAH